MSGIDAVSVNNVIKLYHYLSGPFFCFQALTAFCTAYDCLPMFTELTVCAYKPFYFRVPLSLGGPRRQTETGDGPDCHHAVLMERVAGR